MKKIFVIILFVFLSINLDFSEELLLPKNVIVLEEVKQSYTYCITVVDLDNNEIVLLEYNKTNKKNFEKLIKIVRTNIFINVKKDL